MLRLHGLSMYRDKLHRIIQKGKKGLIIKYNSNAGAICHKSEHSSKSKSIS